LNANFTEHLKKMSTSGLCLNWSK